MSHAVFGHTYIKYYSIFIWNSNLTGNLVFYLAVVYAWWGFHNQGIRKWTKAWRRENAKCIGGWRRVGWELSGQYSRKIIYKHIYKALNASLTDICSVSNGNPFNMSKEGKSYGPSIYPFIHPLLHPSIIASVYLYEYGIWESAHPLNLYSHSATCSLSNVWQIIQLPSASLSWEMGIIRSSSYPFHQDYHAITQCWANKVVLNDFLRPSLKAPILCVPAVTLITLKHSTQFQPFAKALDFIPYQCPYQCVRTASLSPAKSVYRCCYPFRCATNCFLMISIESSGRSFCYHEGTDWDGGNRLEVENAPEDYSESPDWK